MEDERFLNALLATSHASCLTTSPPDRQLQSTPSSMASIVCFPVAQEKLSHTMIVNSQGQKIASDYLDHQSLAFPHRNMAVFP